MNFFSGEYRGRADAKGRLVLPARLKSLLDQGEAGEVILRMGFEPNLMIYPPDVYRVIHERILTLDDFDPNTRAFKRNFFRGVVPLSIDNLGRVLLPKNFMQHAGLTKLVVIVGVGNMIELWNEQRYESYLIKDQQTYSQLAKQLLDEQGKVS